MQSPKIMDPNLGEQNLHYLVPAEASWHGDKAHNDESGVRTLPKSAATDVWVSPLLIEQFPAI